MGQGIYIVIVGIICSSVLISSFKRGSENLPIVKKNLSGNIYYGYTPDWQNFLKCSEWCADNLPSNTLVASRKAPMSFVYGKGKKFVPIYSVITKDSLTQQSNPDSALAFFAAFFFCFSSKVVTVAWNSLAPLDCAACCASVGDTK